MFQIKKALMAVAALAAFALGGAAVAGATSSSAPNQSGSNQGGSTQARPSFPAHGTPAHEDAEKPVTGATAAKVQAAAVKSVGGGKAGPVVNDMSGTGFETTVTKTDGSKVEVHLNGSYQPFQGPGDGDRDGGPGAAGY